MLFKKLDIRLRDILEEMDITEPLTFQEYIYSRIKGGGNYYCIAPDGSGKTMSIVINVVQKLLSTESIDVPRALIFVKDKKAALELEELFNEVTILMDLDVLSIFDSQKIYNQKDSLYEGVDIVISTPQRLHELYIDSGINLVDLKMFILEDAQYLINNKHLVHINRIAESIKKTQYLIFANEYTPRFDELEDTFMRRAKLLELDTSK